MSDETIKLLSDQVKELRAESAKYRKAYADLKKSHEVTQQEWQGKLDASTKELSKATSKLESLPKEYEAKMSELSSKLRERSHRDKFTELAQGLKVREDAIADLYGLSGWKADVDEVDAEAMTAAISTALESRQYLLDTPANQPEVFQARPQPGGGQGASAANVAGSFTMTRAQAADGRFTFEHKAAIQKAAQTNTLRVV